MLLYVVSRRFPLKTFVIMCNPSDTIAKVRANLLHMLYELDKLTHFQLRYNGEYLRDGYSVEDYRLPDNAVVKMIPLIRQQSVDSKLRKRGLSGDLSTTTSGGESIMSGAFQTEILDTLRQEIRIFDRRERLFTDLNVTLYFHWFAALGGFVSSHWYAGVWALVLCFFASRFCPGFTRVTGFIKGRSLGTTAARRKAFLYIISTSCCLVAIASVVLASLNFYQLSYLCGKDACSDTVKYSVFYFSGYAVLLVVTTMFSALLTLTIDIQVGDLVEAKLGQERDIVKVLRVAEGGNKRDKRVAAFELATLAAFSEDNKYLIAGEVDGIGTILRLFECGDQETVNYAAETIANLATILELQDAIVNANGVEVLIQALANPDTSTKTETEALTSLSYIVSDSHDFKERVASTEGLKALATVVLKEDKDPSLETIKTVAALLLEISFLPSIRLSMLREPQLRRSLLLLSSPSIRDRDINLTALQCIELLVIEEKEHEIGIDGFIGSEDSPSDDSLPQQLVNNLHSLLLRGSRDQYFAQGSALDHIDDKDDDHEDDDYILSSSSRSLVRISAKILNHLMDARSHRRRVVLARDLSVFIRVLRKLADVADREPEARVDPDVDGVRFGLVARMIEHSLDELVGGSPKEVKAALDVVVKAQQKTLALEDKDSWNVFNECRKRLEAQ